MSSNPLANPHSILSQLAGKDRERVNNDSGRVNRLVQVQLMLPRQHTNVIQAVHGKDEAELLAERVALIGEGDEQVRA